MTDDELLAALKANSIAEGTPRPIGDGHFLLTIPEGMAPGDVILIELVLPGEDS